MNYKILPQTTKSFDSKVIYGIQKIICFQVFRKYQLLARRSPFLAFVFMRYRLIKMLPVSFSSERRIILLRHDPYGIKPFFMKRMFTQLNSVTLSSLNACLLAATESIFLQRNYREARIRDFFIYSLTSDTAPVRILHASQIPGVSPP